MKPFLTFGESSRHLPNDGQILITAVARKIHPSQLIDNARMHQTLQRRSCTRIVVHHDGALLPHTTTWKAVYSRLVLICGIEILELDDRLCIVEVLQGGRASTRVEDDRGGRSRDGIIREARRIAHVLDQRGEVRIRCLVKEDAVHGDVSISYLVGGPVGVGLDVGGDFAIRAVRIVRADVANRLDIFVRVELVDCGDVVTARICVCRTRAGVGVHDDLPVDGGCGSYRIEDGGPGSA